MLKIEIENSYQRLMLILIKTKTLTSFSIIHLFFAAFKVNFFFIGAVAFSAAYCLIAVGIVSQFSIWIPGWLPLGAVWVAVLFAMILPKPKDSARTITIAASPPTP